MKLEQLFNFTNGKSIVNLEKGNYPIYGSTGIIGSSNKSLISGSNILIARVGQNCGYTQYTESDCWVSDNTIIASSNTDLLIPKYGYYLLGSLNLQKYKIGAAQPLLTIGIIKSIECSIPQISIQEHIVNTILFLLLKFLQLFFLVPFPPLLNQIILQNSSLSLHLFVLELINLLHLRLHNVQDLMNNL